MRPRIQVEPGQRYGKLTVVKRWRPKLGQKGFRRSYSYYWCRCDCGAEQAIRLDRLLGVDALSCAHVQHRGFFCVSPDTIYCQNCGGRRRFFFNGQGFRIFRCGNCEEADIRAWLRYEYGPTSSIQFTANMAKGRTIQPTDPHAKYPGIVRKTDVVEGADAVIESA